MMVLLTARRIPRLAELVYVVRPPRPTESISRFLCLGDGYLRVSARRIRQKAQLSDGGVRIEAQFPAEAQMVKLLRRRSPLLGQYPEEIHRVEGKITYVEPEDRAEGDVVGF
jgi:hypothetical protein